MITFFRLFKSGIVCAFLMSTHLLGSTFGKINAPDPGYSDQFGHSVSQSGNILAVGVPQDDITYSQQGSAYLYRVEANGTNTFLTKVIAPDANNNSEYFGHSVSQSGDILAVGAYGDDDAYTDSGSAYLFRLEANGTATFLTKVTAPDANNNSEYFGHSVSQSGDILAVGAYRDDDVYGDSGSAYLFRLEANGTATFLTKVTAPDANNGSEYFGYSVSQSGDILAVGAYGDDDVYSDSGSAYLFRLEANGTATFLTKVTAPDANNGSEHFGYSVSQSGDILAVGAYGDDDVYSDSGSAYLFRLEANGTATFLTKVTAPDANNGSEYFGYSVSQSGNILAVGAHYDDDAYTDSGSAYLFRLEANGTATFLTKVTAPDANNGSEHFGCSVSQSGDILAVGALNDDDLGTNTGAVYTFDLNKIGTKVTAPDPGESEYFGRSVSQSGNILAVGAYADDIAYSQQGSAYLYRVEANGTNTFLTKVTAPDANNGSEHFGYSVSQSGDILAVGAYGDDDVYTNSGSAYLFRLEANGTATFLTKVTAPDANGNEYFGRSVSQSGDILAVGAYADDDAYSDSGSAYLFRLEANGTATFLTKVTAPDANNGSEHFGYSVSQSGDILAVGAYLDDDVYGDSGSAYLFRLEANGTATFLTKVTAPDPASSDHFGYSVSQSGDILAVGAYLDDFVSNSGSDVGAAYLYRLEADSSVTFLTKIIPPDGSNGDNFGVSVSQSGNLLAVGSWYEDSVYTNSGADYVYDVDKFYPSNTPPSDILMPVSTLPENLPAGTVVGQLSAVDPDDVNSTGTYSYALVSGAGDTDNAQFTIDAGGRLSVNGTTDYESMIADPMPPMFPTPI
jgi:preprotein translocase subunit SecG